MEVPKKNVLKRWYELVKCDLVEVAYYFDDVNSVLVDEEGLFKPIVGFFEVKGAYQPYCGNGLVVGVDSEGNSVSTTMTVDEVKELITFKKQL